MKTWCIGDIHGCYRELMALYKKLLKAGLVPENDIVVFLGDYSDRGPDSKKVISQLIKWHKQYPHWVFLYGNHEDIFLNWYYGKQNYQEDAQWSCFLYNGGKETLKSYGLSEPVRKFPKSHIEFITTVPKLLYETDKYIFVHGGLIPETSIENIRMLLKNEVERETILQALIWARDEFINSEYDWNKKVIFGHTPASKAYWGTFGQPIIMKNKIGIDGAVCSSKLGSNLIAIELPEEKFYFIESFKEFDFLTKMFLENAKDL